MLTGWETPVQRPNVWRCARAQCPQPSSSSYSFASQIFKYCETVAPSCCAAEGSACGLQHAPRTAQNLRRAVRTAATGANACSARRALQESMPPSAARHTCCSCALLAGAAGRARCAHTAHDPQRTARAAAAAPLACSAGSTLGFRRRIYLARGARYKCTIGFLQRTGVSALHASVARAMHPARTVARWIKIFLSTAQ